MQNCKSSKKEKTYNKNCWDFCIWYEHSHRWSTGMVEKKKTGKSFPNLDRNKDQVSLGMRNRTDHNSLIYTPRRHWPSPCSLCSPFPWCLCSLHCLYLCVLHVPLVLHVSVFSLLSVFSILSVFSVSLFFTFTMVVCHPYTPSFSLIVRACVYLILWPTLLFYQLNKLTSDLSHIQSVAMKT